MLVSCLLPTYNRISRHRHLLEEAVESFLKQDYPDKELLICNDTPEQQIRYIHPNVRVINSNFRFPTLGEKLHWMLKQAQGQYICRWDDDDISLPWRLSYSVAKLFGLLPRGQIVPPKNSRPQLSEWRPENHWYDQAGKVYHTVHPGNTHIMSIWHRKIIEDTGMKYPGSSCPSGHEDQTFNRHIWALGFPQYGEVLPLSDIFYFYRFGTGQKHLSSNDMQATYLSLADDVPAGSYSLTPHWRKDYVAIAGHAAEQYKQPVAK